MNTPKYTEKARIHRDPDGTYTAEISEMKWRSRGWVTARAAFSAILRKFKQQASPDEGSAAIVVGLTIVQEARMARMAGITNEIERLRVEYQTLKVESEEGQEVIDDMADVGAPDPDSYLAALLDDEDGIRGSIRLHFREGSRIHTMGLRWPWLDYDKDGDPDHGIVMYLARQPDEDFGEVK